MDADADTDASAELRRHEAVLAAAVLRFTALGDSVTEGLGDPAPGCPGAWRGWAALLAEGLRPEPAGPGGVRTVFTNRAESGALSADVARRQLGPARTDCPHLVAVVAGANDTLRAGFDIREVARNLDAVLAALTADGCVVLTACLPDPGQVLRLPGPLARPLARRMRAVNAVVHTLSDRYGAIHVHATGPEWTADRSRWSVDCLHPSERGHRALAREFHTRLAAAGIACGRPPAAEPDGKAPTRTAKTWWLATRGTRWLLARCTDLLPGLLRLALTELREDADALDRSADRAAALSCALTPRERDARRAPCKDVRQEQTRGPGNRAAT